MPYTFGAATSDRVEGYCSGVGVNGSYMPWLTMLWFRATTLTAGRVLWSAIQQVGRATHLPTTIQLSTTPSEIKLVTGAVTTCCERDSTTASLVTGQWYALAVISNLSSGDTNCAMWLGTETTPPRRLTISNTVANVGTVRSADFFVIGNEPISAPIRAFQGDIADVIHIASNNDGSDRINAFDIGVLTGSLSTALLEGCERKFIMPWWKGESLSLCGGGHSAAPTQAVHQWPGLISGHALLKGSNNLGSAQTAATELPWTPTTIVGATPSAQSHPRAIAPFFAPPTRHRRG